MKNRGQVTLEAVLLMTVFVAFAALVTTQLKQSESAAELVSKPWSYLAGMIETGVWVDSKKTKLFSPYSRGISYIGKDKK